MRTPNSGVTEKVVGRSTEQRYSRRELREDCATNPGIDVAADTLKQLRCSRPFNVVELTNGNHAGFNCAARLAAAAIFASLASASLPSTGGRGAARIMEPRNRMYMGNM